MLRLPRRVPRLRRSTGWRCRRTEFRRLGVEGAWAERYATMDHPSEAAIAGEICKFLLNGALYRGLRPVMWSPGREDRAGRGRDRVPRPHQHDDLGALPGRHRAGARSGGRRAGDLDHHALDHARQPRHRRRRGDRLRADPCRYGDAGLAGARRRQAAGRAAPAAAGSDRDQNRHPPRACGVLHRRRTGRHDLRPPAARARLRPRRAGAVRRFRHHRGRHRLRPHRPRPWRGGFRSSAARTGIEIPDTVGAGRHVQPLGAAVSPACMSTRPPSRSAPRWRRRAGCWRAASSCIPTRIPGAPGAADLPRHAAMVHPHGRAGAHPRAGAGGARRHAFRPRRRAQPHRLHGRRTARLVHQPPARLGRADPGVRRPRAPASRCATRRSFRASSRPSPPRGRTPGTPPRRRASSAPTATPTITSR